MIIVLGVAGGAVLLRDTDATSPSEKVSTESAEQSTLAAGSNAETTSWQADDTTDQFFADGAVADSALDVAAGGPATAGDSNIFSANADTTNQSSSGEMETVSASYDCTAPGLSTTESLICDTPALRKLDAEMARAYRARRTAKLPVIGQQEWLRNRSSCLSSDRREVQIACLTNSYDQRITQLREGV